MLLFDSLKLVNDTKVIPGLGKLFFGLESVKNSKNENGYMNKQNTDTNAPMNAS